MTTRTLPQALTDVVDQIVEQFQPRQIILFGSHATETADAGSDVDLLVIMETPLTPLRQAATISRAVRHHVPIDLFVRTPEQVAIPSPKDIMLRSILREGITVYEAPN